MGEQENPLTDRLLGAAASLCFLGATYTDLDQMFGRAIHMRHCLKKARFEGAREALRAGKPLLELGLTANDVAWAKEQVLSIKPRLRKVWKKSFGLAEEILRKEEEREE